MICFKDRTFCSFKSCQKFIKCDRALTDEVKKQAENWWGSKEAPICQFMEKPDCYVEPKKKC